MSDEQQTQQADDPSGDGWRWVRQGEALRHGDVQKIDGEWHPTIEAGYTCPRNHSYRRRIEPQQPSDSEPETMEDLRRRLAEFEVLLAEAERGGEQVNAELQQLREQVATLTQERDEHARKLEFARESGEMSRRELEDEAGKVEQLKQQLWDAVEARQKAERELATETKGYRDSFKANHRAGQQQVLDRLQAWLRPVLEVVSDHPDHASILAVSVMEFLPQIASRLIEE